MIEISAQMVRAAIEAARAERLDVAKLIAGLPFDERSLRGKRRIGWDDYCVMVERMEVAAGGPDQLADLLARCYHDVIPAAMQIVFGAFVSPRLLFRFMAKVMGRIVFPVDMTYEELGDQRIRLSLQLRPAARGCRAWLSGNLGAIRGATQHLGLPEAKAELEGLTDRSMVMLVHLPASRTLGARARRRYALSFRQASLWMVKFFAEQPTVGIDDSRLAHAPPLPAGEADRLVERVQAAQSELGLTARQAEVLTQLVRGLSNKEIARGLDCAENTVEFHVTGLLHSVGVDTRTRLIARFWENAPGQPVRKQVPV